MTLADLRDDEGVFSYIKTLREYDRLVRAGFVRASLIYARQGILIPTLADFRSAHTEIFADVSAEAGRIRDEDCLVEIFGSVLEDCDLEEEFQLLGKQLRQMVTKAKTVQDCVVIVAFTHGRIVAVQPALMGNKRTAMCLSLAQIRYLFPIITTLNPFSINAYYEALARTVEGRADQLNQVFGQIIGIPGPFTRAPFSARCQPYAESRQRFPDTSMERFSPHGNR
jgi:fido (protein-threonine AMPylation protein)